MRPVWTLLAALLVLFLPAAAAARGAAPVVVFGAERGVNGFNTSLSCCDDPWSWWMGAEEALRGAFEQNAKGVWLKELVSAASASSVGVSYTIKSNAYWYWGGRKVPVTYKDFVYTLQAYDDPANPIADRGGYANLDPARYTHNGLKQVTFFWRKSNCTAATPCGPYGDWQRLFAAVYPSFALKTAAFSTMWTSCICGFDGKPVSDGPYYLYSYAPGVGSVLRANPFWAGKKPAVREIDFKIFPDLGAEVEAMRTGAVDAIAPTFDSSLEVLKHAAGIAFDAVPSYFVEHVAFREGSAPGAPSVTKGASSALLRAPFVREAISLAIDRHAITKAVFGDLAAGGAANSALFYSTEAGYRSHFARWSYNPSRARALMARHCTGGPPTVDTLTTAVWQCSGLPATFTWSWPSGDAAAAVTEAIVKVELRSIGIALVDMPLSPNEFFGAGGIASGGYDIAEFADATSGDPGDWADAYRCRGAVNYTGFCSRSVDRLLAAAARETQPDRRAQDYERADTLLSRSLPVLPMYQRPAVLVHKANLVGMVANPGPGGPFWNVEDWRWRA
jgi:ABC-type transport system substrate-binding protein